jgi:hypothetical protein
MGLMQSLHLFLPVALGLFGEGSYGRLLQEEQVGEGRLNIVGGRGTTIRHIGLGSSLAAASISTHLQVLVFYHKSGDSLFELFDQCISLLPLFLHLVHISLHLFLDGLQGTHKEGMFWLFVLSHFLLVVVIILMLLDTTAVGSALVLLPFLLELIVLMDLANFIL